MTKFILVCVTMLFSSYAVSADCKIVMVEDLAEDRQVSLRSKVAEIRALEICERRRIGDSTLTALGNIEVAFSGWSYFQRTAIFADGTVGQDLLLDFIPGYSVEYDSAGVFVRSEVSKSHTVELFERLVPGVLDCFEREACKKKFTRSYGFIKRILNGQYEEHKRLWHGVLSCDVVVEAVTFLKNQDGFEMEVDICGDLWLLKVEPLSGKEFYLNGFGEIIE